MVKNIEKLIEKLDRSFTILKQLANQIRHNAKKGESGKVWSVFYGVLATGACAGAICTGNLWVYTTVCGVSIALVQSVSPTTPIQRMTRLLKSLRVCDKTQRTGEWKS